MKTRAVRRHHKFRMRKRAKKLFERWLGYNGSVIDNKVIDKLSKRHSDNQKKCSCYICGHTRKNYGQTKQEYKSELKLEEELNEL